MTTRQLLIYLIKCASGCALGYLLCSLVTFVDLRWCLVSIVLVLSPETREELSLALTRIKANLVAAAASMACLLLGPATVFTVALAFAITSTACHFLKLMGGNRSALAAVIIIMIREEPGFHWSSAFGRVVSVIAGCLLAIAVTYLFHYSWKRDKKNPAKSTSMPKDPPSEDAE